MVDSKGEVVPSSYTVVNGKVYDAKNNFVGVVATKVESRVVAHAISRIEAKETPARAFSVSKSSYVPKHAQVKTSSVLPTTGSTNNSIVGAIGLAIASVGSLLGLASSKRKEDR